MDYIEDLKLIEVPLSSGDSTLGMAIRTTSGIIEWDASPLGTTVGELDPEIFDYHKALSYLPGLKSKIVGRATLDQIEIDQVIDEHFYDKASDNMAGANMAIALSCAVARSAACYKRLPLYSHIADVFNTHPALPKVMCNLLGGGGHHKNNMVTTELMILSLDQQKLPYKNILTVRNRLNDVISKIEDEPRIGLEGCLVSKGISDHNAINMLISACNEIFGVDQFKIGLDLACSSNCEYDFVEDICSKYPVATYIEDPFPISQTAQYRNLLSKHPHIMVAGDDLTVGSPNLIEQAYNNKLINTVVLKLNHVGTLSRMALSVKKIKEVSMHTVCSQRSRETSRDTLSHLAIAFACDYMKNGAPLRERVANYSNLTALAQFI